MKLKYLKKKVRQMKINKTFVLFILIIIITAIFFTAIYNLAIPKIKSISQINASGLALEITNNAVANILKDITYENLMNVDKDETGKIVAITSNSIKINKLANNVSLEVLNIFNNMQSRILKIPLTTILDMGFLSGIGPDVKFRMLPTGYATATFVSEFEDAGINQTRHKIYIKINTGVRLIAPFYTDLNEYTNEIVIAETLLIGDIPSTYYNLNGVNTKDTINLLE